MSEWIKCSERLPPMNEPVVIYAYEFKDVAVRQCENEWDRFSDKWIWFISSYHQKKPSSVTHWMPLPPSPKE